MAISMLLHRHALTRHEQQVPQHAPVDKNNCTSYLTTGTQRLRNSVQLAAQLQAPLSHIRCSHKRNNNTQGTSDLSATRIGIGEFAE